MPCKEAATKIQKSAVFLGSELKKGNVIFGPNSSIPVIVICDVMRMNKIHLNANLSYCIHQSL